MTNRWDETWHRLREWTSDQGPSERLAAQVLIDDGYVNVDPSHPLGGQDGGKDALCWREGRLWVMAVHFPRGQQSITEIKKKFGSDLLGVQKNGAVGIAFVTNQELMLAEREELRSLAASKSAQLDLFHLERITAILDCPGMAAVRKQFLQIDFSTDEVQEAVRTQVASLQRRLEGLQTGGDSFCYWMLYHFELGPDLTNARPATGLELLGATPVKANFARNFVVIRKGEFPLYDLRFRIVDLETNKETHHRVGEMNSPAEYQLLEWPLRPSVYYRIFFHARNGSWHQDLHLRKSVKARCWLAATRVVGNDGKVRFEHIDGEFVPEFGPPVWRS